MSKRPALGRGLASLIPEAGSPKKESHLKENDEGGGANTIPIDSIGVGRFQPRTDFDPQGIEGLKNSILEKGILQPLIVRKDGNGYELIAGERRLRAARAAGLEKVPVIVRVADDNESLELALIENVQRNDLNAIELAHGFRKLQEEFGYRQEEISRRVGKDRSTIANHLRLLKLPESIKSVLADGQISMGHARALLALEDDETQERILEEILKRQLSVRETEKLVRREKEPKKEAKRKEASVELEHIAEKLTRAFQTRVKLVPRRDGSGEIRIEFFSSDELNRILELIPEP